jgi:transcriptional regulator with XRE-family HTH domain
MADLQEIMGRVIRRERQERRLTLKEVADKAALSVVYVGEVERGQKYPSAVVLEKLAEALDLTVADLLELVAEEIRLERQPATANPIGFVLPEQPGQARRVVVKRIVNMLDEGEVTSVADFSAYLLARRATNREF